MSLITHLFNLLYPPRCPACGTLVARDGDWCPSCLAAVWHPRRINKPAAVRHLAACYCLADYRGAMRHILHDIKYNGKQGKCRACRVLLDRFPWPERFDRIDRVVPVPLAPENCSAAVSTRPKPSFATGLRSAGIGATPCSACGRRKSSGSSAGTSGRRMSTTPLPSKKPSPSRENTSSSSTTSSRPARP